MGKFNLTSTIQKYKKWLLALLFVCLIVAPFISATSVTRLMTTIFIYSIASYGLMLIFGFTGMMCAGYAAFYGTGAYISAILAKTYGWPFYLCILAAALGTAVVGFIICFPCLRLTVDFVGLISTAFLNIFLTIVRNWTSVTNGPVGIVGIPKPVIFGYEVHEKFGFYFMMLFFAILCYILVRNILNSKIGRNMKGIRDNEIGTVAIGVKARPLKLLVFTMGSFMAGVAGSLYGFYINAVNPMNFVFAISTTFVQMCVLGGLGTLPGAVIGATVITLLPEVFRSLAEYRLGIGGLVMVLMMVFRPQGIAGSRAFAGENGVMYRLQQKVALLRAKKGSSAASSGQNLDA